MLMKNSITIYKQVMDCPTNHIFTHQKQVYMDLVKVFFVVVNAFYYSLISISLQEYKTQTF